MNNEKLPLILAIGILALAIVIGGGIIYYKNHQVQPIDIVGAPYPIQLQLPGNGSTTPEAEWTLFTEAQYGFSFNYPQELSGQPVKVSQMKSFFYLDPYFTDDLVGVNSYLEYAPVALNELRLDLYVPDKSQTVEPDEFAYDQGADLWYGINTELNPPVQYFTWDQLMDFFTKRVTCDGLIGFKLSESLFAIPFTSQMPAYNQRTICGYHIIDRAHHSALVLKYEMNGAMHPKTPPVIKKIVESLKLPQAGLPIAATAAHQLPIKTFPAFQETAGWISYTDPTTSYQIKYPATWTRSTSTPYFVINNPDVGLVQILTVLGQDAAAACQRKAFVLNGEVIEQHGDSQYHEIIGGQLFRVFNESDAAMHHYSSGALSVTTTKNVCYGVRTVFEWSGYCDVVDPEYLKKEGFNSVEECQAATRKSVTERAAIIENIVRTFQVGQ